MKKFLNFCILLLFIFSVRMNVNALSASLTVNKSTIEKGSTVKATVTVSGAAAWNIKIFSSGATNGCDASYADATGDGKNTTKSFTVTCDSMATGVINFSISGDITSEDGSNKTISGSKSVKVTEPRAKSTNNDLASLSVDNYEISPSFSKDTLEYTVDVPNTVNTIKINAKAADNYASVTGAGEVEVLEGANKFSIVVTSETGKEKTYTLTVNVEDKEPIVVEVDGVSYTVVKNAKALTMPELFVESSVVINEFTIPAFYNELANITLVGLKDSDGNVSLFSYDDGKYIKYNELKASNLILMVIDKKDEIKHFKKSTIVINELTYDCLASESNKDYVLFYAMNLVNGKTSYYMFDSVDQTLQRYDDTLINEMEENLDTKDKNIKTLYIICGIISLFTIIILITFGIKNRKIKKVLEITNDKTEKKDKKESKK